MLMFDSQKNFAQTTWYANNKSSPVYDLYIKIDFSVSHHFLSNFLNIIIYIYDSYKIR